MHLSEIIEILREYGEASDLVSPNASSALWPSQVHDYMREHSPDALAELLADPESFDGVAFIEALNDLGWHKLPDVDVEASVRAMRGNQEAIVLAAHRDPSLIDEAEQAVLAQLEDLTQEQALAVLVRAIASVTAK